MRIQRLLREVIARKTCLKASSSSCSLGSEVNPPNPFLGVSTPPSTRLSSSPPLPAIIVPALPFFFFWAMRPLLSRGIAPERKVAGLAMPPCKFRELGDRNRSAIEPGDRTSRNKSMTADSPAVGWGGGADNTKAEGRLRPCEARTSNLSLINKVGR